VLDQITELDQDDQRSPATATREDLDVLDLLPHLAVNLHRAPAKLQVRLYELTKLRISIDHETDHAMIDITLPGDRIEEVATAAADVEVVRVAKPQVKPGVIAAGAPGEIRTHTGRVLNPLPLPVGLRGRDVVTLRDRRTPPVTGAG
jgi:site-specific DNA recombinase